MFIELLLHLLVWSTHLEYPTPNRAQHCIEEILLLLESNHGGAAGTGRNEKFVPLPLDPKGDDA